MCRWLAYCGPPIHLDKLLVEPEQSLVRQSLHARQAMYAVNGDGFGVGWYGDRPWPGVYHDIHPAWNDDNLRHLAQQIRSGLFMAHVRLSSGTAVQRTNCHPFRYKHWLFQHNGSIGGFERLRRTLDMQIAPELYPKMAGSTDTERMFFLALTFGLLEDPPVALRRMVATIEQARSSEAVSEPLEMTVAAADGRRLFAVRYASHDDPPSLYHSRNIHALRELHGDLDELPSAAVVVLSEPLDRVSEHWEEIPASTMLIVEEGHVAATPFEPAK